MKTNEFMVGDWVLDGTQIAQITSITYGGVIETTAHEFSNIEVIEPIPLTAEILEKNGFDCSDEEVVRYNFTDGDYQGHFSLRRMYSVNTPNGWSFFAFNVLTIIDYVHELQHALKLCGIDKNIEL